NTTPIMRIWIDCRTGIDHSVSLSATLGRVVCTHSANSSTKRTLFDDSAGPSLGRSAEEKAARLRKPRRKCRLLLCRRGLHAVVGRRRCEGPAAVLRVAFDRIAMHAGGRRLARRALEQAADDVAGRVA